MGFVSLFLVLIFTSAFAVDIPPTVPGSAGCFSAVTTGVPGEKVKSAAREKREARFTSLDVLKREALAAGRNFTRFFGAITDVVLERDYVTELMQLGLIAKEYVLILGPGGTAKSQQANLVYENIVDEKGEMSYFRLQLTQETTISETHGPLKIKRLIRDDVYERVTDESMLDAHFFFLDETFDTRANANRNIFGLINERQHNQGKRVTKGRTLSGAFASNRYISEVYKAAGNDGPRAFLDRIAFVAFVPKRFEFTDSYVRLIEGLHPSIPKLQISEVKAIEALVPHVTIPDSVKKTLALLDTSVKSETEALEQSSLKESEEKLRRGEAESIPYRATKIESPRTVGKESTVLRAIVVWDWIKKGGRRPLKATLPDLKVLEKMFVLNGPSEEFVQELMSISTNPHETAQLMAIIQEREIFVRHLSQINAEISDTVMTFALDEIAQNLSQANTPAERLAVEQLVTSKLLEIEAQRAVRQRHKDLTGKLLGLDYVHESLVAILADLNPQLSAAAIKGQLAEAHQKLTEEAERVRLLSETPTPVETPLPVETPPPSEPPPPKETQVPKEAPVAVTAEVLPTAAPLTPAEREGRDQLMVAKLTSIASQAHPLSYMQEVSSPMAYNADYDLVAFASADKILRVINVGHRSPWLMRSHPHLWDRDPILNISADGSLLIVYEPRSNVWEGVSLGSGFPIEKTPISTTDNWSPQTTLYNRAKEALVFLQEGNVVSKKIFGGEKKIPLSVQVNPSRVVPHAISPDGSWVTYVAKDIFLVISINVDTGQVVTSGKIETRTGKMGPALNGFYSPTYRLLSTDQLATVQVRYPPGVDPIAEPKILGEGLGRDQLYLASHDGYMFTHDKTTEVTAGFGTKLDLGPLDLGMPRLFLKDGRLVTLDPGRSQIRILGEPPK